MNGDIKHIVVIQSLSQDQLQTGRELYEDTIVRTIEMLDNGMTHEFVDVNSKDQLIEFLKYINAKSPYIPGGTVVHLEMHGSEDLSGLVLSNSELINWNELVERFRDINIGSSNRLYITMATCFGRYLYQGVNPELKSPYCGYLSASKEVLVREVIERFSDLFEGVISNGNLIRAYLELDATGSSFYYKDSKTTFEENIMNVKHQFDNDQQFKQSFIDDVKATRAQFNVEIDDIELEIIRRKAFNDIVRRHKQAFEFPEEQ